MISFASICKDAAGVAGNVFAFALFVSPIHTFRRVVRNRSTEEFSGLPYVYSLLNCLICFWYGTPFVSRDNLLVVTVNSVGAVFQLIYTILFIKYAGKTKKLRMLGLLLSVFGLFAAVVFGSLCITDHHVRRTFVGLLSVASVIFMCASPLFIIKLVIQTASVEFMPFFLSLSTFLMSSSFLSYGILNCDAFIYIPNGVGAALGVVQLLLYHYYRNSTREGSREPFVASLA